MKKLILVPSLAISLNMSAQTVEAGFPYANYYDINPDQLLFYTVTPYSNNTYDIDLFGDAAKDIQFTAHGAVSSGGSGAYISVAPLDPNVSISMSRLDSVFVPATSMWNVTKVAKPLGSGEQINAGTAIWENSMMYLTDHSGSGGGNKDVNDWVGIERYVGLKYQNGTSISYGWVKVGCISQDTCYIREWSSSPAVVGIKERSLNNTMLYPNPSSGSFYLKNITTASFDISKLKLKDLYGKEFQFFSEAFGNDLRIDLGAGIAPGCYVLEYVSNDQVFTKKLVKVSR